MATMPSKVLDLARLDFHDRDSYFAWRAKWRVQVYAMAALKQAFKRARKVPCDPAVRSHNQQQEVMARDVLRMLMVVRVASKVQGQRQWLRARAVAAQD